MATSFFGGAFFDGEFFNVGVPDVPAAGAGGTAGGRVLTYRTGDDCYTAERKIEEKRKKLRKRINEIQEQIRKKEQQEHTLQAKVNRDAALSLVPRLRSLELQISVLEVELERLKDMREQLEAEEAMEVYMLCRTLH